ncbi:hypothetical protein AVEN_39024-1 [Araneus ventricosus]|uniref:Uncharacterized protein n=1 Tax=Araneus ventricosus TaxID=182803 RepID=A0A4Y2QFI4_ARAVE|nr:hypothetical protein AVEN_252089-1 [Araneus ventricosus]GBN62626.1 hypothetical protein AVEN_39024-1 [Araneus ventricosus]
MLLPRQASLKVGKRNLQGFVLHPTLYRRIRIVSTSDLINKPGPHFGDKLSTLEKEFCSNMRILLLYLFEKRRYEYSSGKFHVTSRLVGKTINTGVLERGNNLFGVLFTF